MDEVLTTAEVAARLGVSRYRVWQLIKGGRLPATRRGRDLFVRATDLARLERRPVGRPSKTKTRTQTDDPC